MKCRRTRRCQQTGLRPLFRDRQNLPRTAATIRTNSHLRLVNIPMQATGQTQAEPTSPLPKRPRHVLTQSLVRTSRNETHVSPLR